MTIFIWDPANDYRKGSSKHISTQGFQPSRHPLTISSQGFILPILADINIFLAGDAITSIVVAGGYIGDGIIIVDGASAPISTVLNDIRIYEYEPVGTLDIDGASAPFIIDINGEIIYDYSSIGADGPDLSGAGDTEFIPGTGLVPAHGGRGVLRPPTVPRTFKKAPHIWIWTAPLLRRFAIKVKGSAKTSFKAGHPYPFIHNLPTIEIQREEHLELFKTINDYVKRQQELPTSYEYTSSAKKKLIFNNTADYSFHSPLTNQRNAEEELILTLTMDNSTPILFVNFDKNITRLRKEDDLILDLLDF